MNGLRRADVLKRLICLLILTGGLAGISAGAVRALDTNTLSPWIGSGNPTLQKSVELSSNILPPSANLDCTEVTVRPYGSSSMRSDCVVMMPLGQVGAGGVVFAGTSTSIPVVPPPPFSGLQPIPNQAMLITYSSAPVIGNYFHIYRSIRDKMAAQPQNVNGQWQYRLTAGPDFSLRDPAGKLLPVNVNILAFSPNGNWMVADVPWQGIIRVNLATFEIRPLASSLQQQGEYADHRAQIAISNDGRNVVLKPAEFNQLKVYDLSQCDGTSLPVQSGTDRCAVRDYFDSATGQIPGFKTLYQPRFVNGTQLTFTAVYDFAPGNFKVAKYTLTAPGQSVSGINYLGMGDSFASGEGAYDYVSGTDTSNDKCHLSSRAYSFTLTSQLFSAGHSIACSGAKTTDITDISGSYRGQVKDKVIKDDRSDVLLQAVISSFLPGYLSQSEFIDQYKPDAVTLSIGGNDIGFADIIKSCVSPVSLPESCYPTYEDRLELARSINGKFDDIVRAYQAVLKPGKRVYAIGYPQVALPGGNCAANVHLDDHELRMAQDLIEYLNLVVSRAAEKAGARYIEVSDAFTGHRLCETKSSDVAVNGFTAGNDAGLGPVSVIGNESYHPNALGHQLLAQTIRARTNNLQQAMPDASPHAQPPALPVSLDTAGLPRTGRPTSNVIPADGLAPGLLVRAQNVNVALDATVAALKAFTIYKILLHSDQVEIGSAATDSSGNLNTTVQIPATVPPGFHTLHVRGENLVGEPVDIVKTVYIAASPDDYNGNGVDNPSDPCPLLAASGQDADRDGIDDACDGDIGIPPAPPLKPWSSSVTLTGNSMTINLTKP